jgi:cyclopropane fatty-acyl-phospholipid synthase-like methyltransferase
MVIRVFGLAWLLVLTLPWSQAAPASPVAAPAIQEYEHGGDVPYVPTPHDVVEQMLKLAGVRKTDVVYDLGCGDGRIVVMAAQKFGARGVGIDIDPERIAEAKQNAEQAGVTDRVKFVQQNLFDADVREATVVTLYLLPSVNLRLRPKLQEQLKPGARIVSHSFDMGDWKPDKEVEYNGRKLYLWIIKPASGNAR